MILKNCKVKWAKVHAADDRFPPAKWSIDVYVEGEQLNACKVAGLKLKTDEDGAYVTVKRNEKTAKGQMAKPPRVVNMNKQPFEENIGNGSVCNVILTPWNYDFAGKKGVTALLDAVQVVEHVPYENKDAEDFDGPPAPGAEDDLPF